MQLKSIDSEDVGLVAEWLGDEENFRWLHFSHGLQKLNAVGVKIMIQRDIHDMRLFTPDDEDQPVGLVALSDIDQNFGTATVWAVLGDKRYGGNCLTTRAVSRLLTVGFQDLGLEAINAWTLEVNEGGRRILDRLNFTLIGRQRGCHVMDGRRFDRLWYDILADEHEEK